MNAKYELFIVRQNGRENIPGFCFKMPKTRAFKTSKKLNFGENNENNFK